MLTARSAFVIQVEDGVDRTGAALDGRVEHVVSGRSARFSSGADLLAFIVEALREPVDARGTVEATAKSKK